MRAVGDASPYEQNPNQIARFDLERKIGGADMETADIEISLSGGEMEQARSDDVGDGVLDVPFPLVRFL